jgi:hypothetical protein
MKKLQRSSRSGNITQPLLPGPGGFAACSFAFPRFDADMKKLLDATARGTSFSLPYQPGPGVDDSTVLGTYDLPNRSLLALQNIELCCATDTKSSRVALSDASV